MPSDLERFLQQAAERLAEKARQAQGQQPAPPPVRQQPPVRQRERQVRPPEPIEPEVIEAVAVDATTARELGPSRLSNIDTRPSLAQEVGLADEKMAEHVHDALDHKVMGLEQSSSGTGSTRSAHQDSTGVQHRQLDSSPMIEMLRQPETLRAAFIASEIFARKFQ